MSAATPRRTWVEQVMGLPVSILARGVAARGADAEAGVRRAYAVLAEADAVFSTYKPDSAISRLARGELSLAECPEDVRSVAERCEWARELTHGWFDATRPDGVWDPSGLVKGWAAERAFAELLEVGDTDWCLNAGGDVVVRSVSGEPFNVGIQDPRDEGRVCAVVPRVDGAVATSGTAARGAHLYDPRSGGAAGVSSLSVSVCGPSLEVADVLATAAFVAGDSWLDVVGPAPDYAALRVGSDGGITAGPEWPAPATGSAPAPAVPR